MKRTPSPMASTMRRYSSASGECCDPAEVPVFRVVQVGEAAVDQRAHEVERERRARVAVEQRLRVRRARSSGEFGPVDRSPR